MEEFFGAVNSGKATSEIHRNVYWITKTLQRDEELEVGVSRTVIPKSLYPLSPKDHNDFCVATFLHQRGLWSQQDYRLSSLNKVKSHKKSWKLWCEEETGPPPPPKKPQTPHAVCWISELPSVHQVSNFFM